MYFFKVKGTAVLLGLVSSREGKVFPYFSFRRENVGQGIAEKDAEISEETVL